MNVPRTPTLMNNLFTVITPDSDLYEVSLEGHKIVRIQRYLNGSSTCQEMEFDDLNEETKKSIIQKAVTIIKNA